MLTRYSCKGLSMNEKEDIYIYWNWQWLLYIYFPCIREIWRFVDPRKVISPECNEDEQISKSVKEKADYKFSIILSYHLSDTATIGKPNNFKVFGTRKYKETKQHSQNYQIIPFSRWWTFVIIITFLLL